MSQDAGNSSSFERQVEQYSMSESLASERDDIVDSNLGNLPNVSSVPQSTSPSPKVHLPNSLRTQQPLEMKNVVGSSSFDYDESAIKSREKEQKQFTILRQPTVPSFSNYHKHHDNND